MEEPDLSRFTVVLARAEEAGNIGSVCRAMKTMGLTRLVLAECPDFDAERVRTMSVHAFDLYENCARAESLAEALSGVSLSAGFSRRRGERRKTFSLSVEDFAGMCFGLPMTQARDEPPSAPAPMRGGDVALVFGNERSGLSGEELSLCSLAVHIPSSEIFPSLNLAQAVQIACYEIRTAALGRVTGSYQPASRRDVAATIERASLRLADLGFFRLNQGEELREFLRDLCERAALSPSELRYFEAFIHKMAGLAGKAGRAQE